MFEINSCGFSIRLKISGFQIFATFFKFFIFIKNVFPRLIDFRNCGEWELEFYCIFVIIGKGYHGGRGNKCQGWTYTNNLPKRSHNNNVGGGGGTGTTTLPGGGGGGGYGTNGKDGLYYSDTNGNGGKGGISYGNSEIKLIGNNNNKLLLGSGGGCGHDTHNAYYGTNGGGSIIIECKNNIIIENNSNILTNGENRKDNIYSGCGSGGTIYLKAGKVIVNNGLISSIGGINKNGPNGPGAGGFGRIRIDCTKENKIKYIDNTNNYTGIFRPKIGFIDLIWSFHVVEYVF